MGIVCTLLAHDKVDVNAKDSTGCTALLVLAYHHVKMDIFRELLQHTKIDVHAVTKDGETALIVATRRCQSTIRAGQSDMHKDVDINERFEGGETAIIRAAISGKPGRGHKGNVRNVVALLPYRKLDVNAKDDNGYTALMRACSRGKFDVVWELLQNDDVDVNAKTSRGWTSLLLAIDQYFEDKKFVDNTHGPNARDNQNLQDIVGGQTALHYASREGHSPFVSCELLKKEKVDVNGRTWSCGDTPLICASRAGHLGIVRMLLRIKNVDVHVKNDLDVARNPGIAKCLQEYIKITLGGKRKRTCRGVDQTKEGNTRFRYVLLMKHMYEW